ncbi:hypothetical protein EPUL_002746 [Erysiphe pulchra]|uniref:Uncharacterized protein n=1 Tax=Erysiphe pulchra TaxID=225359 RepID=A0A2S4PYX0_9PEZI|nr:hypothetical protein EPUL_002746 [Erysiphe pulchra]
MFVGKKTVGHGSTIQNKKKTMQEIAMQTIKDLTKESFGGVNNAEDFQNEPWESHYSTSFGCITNTEAKLTTNALINNAFLHCICPKLPKGNVSVGHPQVTLQDDHITSSKNSISFTFISILNRYRLDKFAGFFIDTGAAKYSSGGKAQMTALRQLSPDITTDELNKNEQWTIHFGMGESTAKQRAEVMTTIGQFIFYIFETATPFLICLADLKKCGFYLNNLTNTLKNVDGSRKIPVIVRWGHCLLPHMPKLSTYMIDAIECEDQAFLKDRELTQLSRRLGHSSTAKLRKILERTSHDFDNDFLNHLNKICHHCQKFGKPPGRFRFHLKDNVDFNAVIIVDIFYISERGKAHPVLHILDEATRFQNAGPKGLVPTLLVFGAYSKICNLDAPAVSVEQRAKAYRKAMEEVRKLRADRQIKDALGMRNGPTTSAIRDLPLQSQVLVWREGNSGKKGSWQGPYILVGIDENTCSVKLHENSNKLSAFRITSVKPYFSNIEEELTDKSLAA